MTIKLSVVIITYNEEKNLSRCLSSVIDLADDIVILDSFSTDRTEEIARRFGANFIQHEFDGHIEQKNRANSYAKYPYILSLDADEILSQQLKVSIYKVKNDWKYDGYFFSRLTNYCGEWIHHTSWYPAKKLRLFDRTKGNWGGYNPHDRFIMNPGCKIEYLEGNLLHYSYFTISEHISRINYYSQILSKTYFQEKRKSNIFKIVVRSIWRFFRDYVLKFGFLDGFYGLIISVNSGYETFLKYSMLLNLIRQERKKLKKCTDD